MSIGLSRRPWGFEKDGRQLVEAENDHDDGAALAMVQKDGLSKRVADRELDTSRPTIDRALEHGELYGL